MATQGFQGWARRTDAAVAPSQHVTDDFPALTAGPTIEINRDESSLTVTDRIASTGYDWDALTPWASRTSPPTSTPLPTGPSSAPRGHVDGNAVIGALSLALGTDAAAVSCCADPPATATTSPRPACTCAARH